MIPVVVREEQRELGRASSAASSTPSPRSPVPASRTIRVAPQTSSTQLVFPPTAAVSGPGVAMLPRTPQKRIFMAAPYFTAGASLVFPRDVPTVTDDSLRSGAGRSIVALRFSRCGCGLQRRGSVGLGGCGRDADAGGEADHEEEDDGDDRGAERGLDRETRNEEARRGDEPGSEEHAG